MLPVERVHGYEEEHSSHLLWKGIDNGGLISAEEDDAGGAAMTFSSVVGQFLQMAPCPILRRPSHIGVRAADSLVSAYGEHDVAGQGQDVPKVLDRYAIQSDRPRCAAAVLRTHNPAVAYCDQIVFDHDYW